ncbi:hypothetical protein OF83DRAFT_457577 [Amylostereum chailletii]|nr:hypothetical protein OF83DRAFT_457577 [Amylostereum chailletii]
MAQAAAWFGIFGGASLRELDQPCVMVSRTAADQNTRACNIGGMPATLGNLAHLQNRHAVLDKSYTQLRALSQIPRQRHAGLHVWKCGLSQFVWLLKPHAQFESLRRRGCSVHDARGFAQSALSFFLPCDLDTNGVEIAHRRIPTTVAQLRRLPAETRTAEVRPHRRALENARMHRPRLPLHPERRVFESVALFVECQRLQSREVNDVDEFPPRALSRLHAVADDEDGRVVHGTERGGVHNGVRPGVAVDVRAVKLGPGG